MSTQNAGHVPRNVSRAVVIKSEDIFVVTEHGGGIPSGNQDGFGIYYHDCRYLDGYELRISGTTPNPLVSTAAKGSVAKFELTNETLQLANGNSIAAQTFGLEVQRVIDAQQRAVHDVITVVNHDVSRHDIGLSFHFTSSFEDVFEIRGLHPKKVGRVNTPQWQDGVLTLSYNGADGVNRRVEVHLHPQPHKTSASGAELALSLDAGERQDVRLSLRIIESKEHLHKPHLQQSDIRPVTEDLNRQSSDWLAKYAEVQSDNYVFNSVLHRSFLDLLMLRSELDGCEYISAGLPWYGALFGRDSIIAALETLAYEPNIAEQTIRLLTKYQGPKTDNWRDEEPGKILHELRRGELANLKEIPQTPYYGSVDSTPLFLILIGEHANWTGNLALFTEFRSNIERALEWIDKYGDLGNNGYLSYATKSKQGFANQGWKDSGDAVMNSDGTLAVPPIALVEVQGYVYRAKVLIADLYARSGNQGRAAQLRHEAAELKVRFNRDFWLQEQQFYAIALQKDSRPAAVISSNPGQALWTRIIDDSKAEAVVRRLTAADMFSGWGVRTLSTKERRANPIGYHLGTVWPHDNSIIAAGFRRYGFNREALNIVSGIVQASRSFEHNRLPEVFAGFSREEFAVPVRYPVACHPQAWAAGSVPFMLMSLLGVMPEAFDRRLRIVRPLLPDNVNDLELRNLKIGQDSVDLRFRRTKTGEIEVDTLKRSGATDIAIEPKTESKAA